jgi:FkbM family methyltransferase
MRDFITQSVLYRRLRSVAFLRFLRDLGRYGLAFGGRAGARLSMRMWRKPGEIIKADLPTYLFPIYLRAGTSDTRVFDEVILHRAYDFALPANAGFIVDAGANIGMASLFFANRYPNAKLVAIEPAGDNAVILHRNVDPYGRIEVRKAGLWHRSEPLRIVDLSKDYWSFSVQACPPGESDFQGITIPDILRDSGVDTVDILKIDIEGAERQLLFEGETDWLRCVKLLIIELHGDLAAERFAEVEDLFARYDLRLIHAGLNCFFGRE